MSKVFFLSGDLIFASRVQAAAAAAGCPYRLLGKLPSPPSDGTDDGGSDADVGWIIIDLSTRAAAVSDVAEAAGQQYPQARLIAYGPHVQTGRLQAARDAGIREVYTRGQFAAKLGNLFASVD